MISADDLILKDNSVIICPNSVKENLIKKIQEKSILCNFKFLTKQEVVEGFGYSFDCDAIYYLHNKYNFSYEISEEILNNLCDISFNDKTKKLNNYYEELNNNGLLESNKLFYKLFNNKKVYILGYSELDKELTNVLDKMNINYEYIQEKFKEYKHDYFYFENIDEEVAFIFDKLMSLVKSGVSLNKIYFYDYSSDYDFLIKKYFSFLNLMMEGKNKIYLYETPIYKKFINYLSEYDAIEAYNKLKEETFNDPFDVLSSLVKCLNKVLSFDLNKEELISFINYLAKKETIKQIKYEQAIKIIDDSYIVNDDEYVFILGFSIDSYPKIYKDIDFLLDEEKEKIGKNTSLIDSKMARENLINFIKRTNNLYITYKKKMDKNEYYLSLLVEELNMNKKKESVGDIRYSNKLAQVEVSKSKDMYRVFGYYDGLMKNFSNEEIRYNGYNHSFKPFNDYSDTNFHKLSYSQISEYNSCPFQYFIKRVLGANIFEDKFTTELGNLSHKILEDSLTKTINLDDYKDEINDKFKTNKDKFFLKLLLPQVLEVIEKNKFFTDNSAYNQALAEQVGEINIDSKTKLVGKIDKVLFDEEHKRLLVVDYKSYNFKFNLKKTKYGMDLQLPIYSLLVKKMYPNYLNSGIYIQNICVDKNNEKNSTPYLLCGLTRDDECVINLDKTLGTFTDEDGKTISKSKFIEGLSKKKDDISFLKGNSLSGTDFDSLSEIAKEKIDECIKNIREGKFDISPIFFVDEYSPNKKTVCEMCSCKCICFMKNSDKRNVSTKEEKENEV